MTVGELPLSKMFWTLFALEAAVVAFLVFQVAEGIVNYKPSDGGLVGAWLVLVPVVALALLAGLLLVFKAALPGAGDINRQVSRKLPCGVPLGDQETFLSFALRSADKSDACAEVIERTLQHGRPGDPAHRAVPRRGAVASLPGQVTYHGFSAWPNAAKRPLGCRSERAVREPP